jgi:hypothetical protein
MVVIDGEATEFTVSVVDHCFWFTADRTAAILLREHPVVVIGGDSIFGHQRVFPPAFN